MLFIYYNYYYYYLLSSLLWLLLFKTISITADTSKLFGSSGNTNKNYAEIYLHTLISSILSEQNRVPPEPIIHMLFTLLVEDMSDKEEKKLMYWLKPMVQDHNEKRNIQFDLSNF